MLLMLLAAFALTPLLLTVAFARAWSSLGWPWLFVLAGLLVGYLSAWIIGTWAVGAFAGVGLSGVPSGDAIWSSPRGRLAVGLVGLVVANILELWVIRTAFVRIAARAS